MIRVRCQRDPQTMPVAGQPRPGPNRTGLCSRSTDPHSSRHAATRRVAGAGICIGGFILVWAFFVAPIGLADGPFAGDVVEGITEPFFDIDIAAADPDVIEAIYVKEGDRVQQGQLLAQLHLDVLNSSLKIARTRAQMQGQLAAAAADLQLKRDRLANLERLRDQGHARVTEMQRARSEVAIAEATLLAARESQTIAQLEIERINSQIERRRLRSPINGVVSKIFRDQAEFVTAVDPHVLTVVQLDPLRATFAVPARLVPGLRPKQHVVVRFSESGERVTGIVEFVAPTNDAESGTVRVKVLVANSDERLRSGARCLLEVPPAETSVSSK